MPSPKRPPKSSPNGPKASSRATSQSPRVKATRSPTKRSARASAKQRQSDAWAPLESDVGVVEWTLRSWVGPTLLMLLVPVLLNVAAFVVKDLESDVFKLRNMTPSEVLHKSFQMPNQRVAKAVALFALFETFLFVALPGETFEGARAPSGFVPKFRKTGGAAYVITMLTFEALAHFQLLDPCIVYDELLPLVTLVNIALLVGSVLLFIKGTYAPSTPDFGSDAPLPFQIYWGAELYPSIMGIDLKHLLICRGGMMGWAIFTLSLAHASVRHHGSVTPALAASVALNGAYVAKFFLFFEPGYMSAADIAVDRFVG